MANRNRPIQVKFRVTPEERAMIDRRMAQAETLSTWRHIFAKWQLTDMWSNWICPNSEI